MADSKQSDVLTSLATIYRFPGGLRSPGEVDIERPIQVVHDVSGISGRSTIRYLTREHTMIVPVGAIDYLNYDDINARIEAGDERMTKNTSDVWLLNIQAFVLSTEAANFTNASAFVAPPAGAQDVGGGKFELYAQRVYVADSPVSELIELGGSWNPVQYTGSARVDRNQIRPLPARIGLVFFRAEAGAGGQATVSFRATYAVCPRGVLPPTSA